MKSQFRARTLRVFALIAFLLSWPVGSTAQGVRTQPDESERLFDRLIGGDRKVIPGLEAAYRKLPADNEFRSHIASLLVSRGVDNAEYFNLLLDLAKQAIETDMPGPVAYDAKGRPVPDSINPAFVEWCNRHRLEPVHAAYDAWWNLPGKVIPLAASGDPRGLPLLLQGLHSPNYMVVTVSAKGLARINDKRAIAPIIEACQKAPTETVEAIAWSLLYFDDARAQEAADKFISNREFLETFRRDAKQKGVQGIFGW